MERMETLWQQDAGRAPTSCQEVVVLTSMRANALFKSELVRTWVSDLDGTGLETDITDPVEVLSESAAGSDLTGFHARAITEVLRRMGSDYEVANLFCDDQALGLG